MNTENMSAQAEQLLLQVKKSPAAVAVHDKSAWMDIFAKYHVVEDPVGSTPHVGGGYDAAEGQRGHGALSRFFDTYIAPNTITFEVAQDLVCGNHVVRDLNIHIQMSPTVSATVPMHLLYELVDENGTWKIVRLAAHWELLPMVMQLLGKGMGAVSVLSALTVRMVKLQGLGGVLGFSKAALNIGSRGKTALQTFVDACNQQNLAMLMSVMQHDNAVIHWPYGTATVSASELFAQLQGKLSISKLLAAGDCVTATVSCEQAGVVKQGVLIAEFNKKTKKMSALRAYF